ncbi:MAG: hypothetical protein IH872_10675 [Chloroflexi bacterium]|nr:hypothetical protein [Chloroflexota bacterium]
MTGMKRLGAVLVPLLILALACGEAGAPQTPLPPALEATVQAVVSETRAANQSTAESDTEATITARVQATVMALINATPIPSPTPTRGVSTPTIQPTGFTTTQGGSFNTVPAPTATRIPTRTPTPSPTLLPTRLAPCSAAADGVEVSAWVNGFLAASTRVQSGSYTLLVEQPSGASFSGQTITFKVGGFDAKQTVRWMQGGATELVLSAPGGGLSRLDPAGSGQSSLAGGLTAQPLPPHVILGTVFVGDC